MKTISYEEYRAKNFAFSSGQVTSIQMLEKLKELLASYDFYFYADIIDVSTMYLTVNIYLTDYHESLPDGMNASYSIGHLSDESKARIYKCNVGESYRFVMSAGTILSMKADACLCIQLPFESLNKYAYYIDGIYQSKNDWIRIEGTGLHTIKAKQEKEYLFFPTIVNKTVKVGRRNKTAEWDDL